MADSAILFLAVCSNGKLKGGVRSYDDKKAITKILPDQAQKLLKARRKVFDLLKNKKLKRRGEVLSEFPFNVDLVAGKDLGGDDSKGKYMPAIIRYQGRFYKELDSYECGQEKELINIKTEKSGLGQKFENRLNLFVNSPHHLLIISGLYGLLTPLEPIQCYSLNISDDLDLFREIWKGDGLLTSILLSYIRKFNIKRIFDLIAVRSYRDLIDWKRIKNKVEVFRAFGSQNVGSGLLPSLGYLLANELMMTSEYELLSIKSGKLFFAEFEEVKLIDGDQPPEGYPGNIKSKEENNKYFDTKKADKGLPDQISGSQYKRRLLITSGKHRTIFGYQIKNSIDELPGSVRPIFKDMELLPEIERVKFSRFEGSIPKKTGGFRLSILEPKQNSGCLLGRLKGIGKIGGFQEIEIYVEPGKEIDIYIKLQKKPWAEH